MNSAVKAAIFSAQINPILLRASFFHSTPVLERKRRNSWNASSKSTYYSRRFRKLHSKQSLLRNVSAYADLLFEGWRNEFNEGDPSSSGGTSWFKKKYSKGSGRCWTSSQGSQRRGKKDFQFCEDEVEVENIFHSAFGGSEFFYWSFIDEDTSRWNGSSGYSKNYGNSWNWRYRVEEEYEDYSTESDSSEGDLIPDRLALGLAASGPLKLEEVKNAYRSCALKWHPDRHQGSSKVVAEEKFKLCSAAYQSLCDKLATA
ncbi:uncharacterized protein LOC119985781 isoform X1 [Tripterygium wilfordii]|uniref:uncharacterized protein LOC119985781 isoform X1 n=1 Tax=Tripterygium wilfordii TaxID=458696 RepID=UPI0018F83E74|nr:uncharacterized protein LOC119985781 isoform X1 [Tripterygium wilfordii]